MRVQLVCLSLLLAFLAMSSSGCVVLAAGAGAAGTVAYVRGDLEAQEQHSIDHVYAAAKKAAEDLRLHVISGEGGKDALSATIVARDAADKRVTIKLKTVTEDITSLSIRVGTFGDQTKQRLIYSKIHENLKAMSAPPAQAPAASPVAESVPAPPDPQASQADAQMPSEAVMPEPAVSESASAEMAAQDAPTPAVPQ